jgi:signal transduction histidine kinase/AmiR/NasT family two-component response regulator
MDAEPKSAPADQPPDLSGIVPLQSVLCTEELNRRPSRPPDYELENRALASLAQALADSPLTILQKMAEIMLETFRADSSGFSLLTKDDGGKRFHWPAIAGVWKPHIGGGTPREFGPCGDVLDRNCPLLFRHFERRYTYFQPVTPPVEECLLVPFYVEGKAVGTIWLVAHDARRKFDGEDLRMLVSLGVFASAAYQAVERFHALSKQTHDRQTIQQSLRDMNEALVLGSVHQHGLTETAENLNKQLRAEITERKRVESKLNEAIAVAEKASLAKSDFLSSMSHELRTPLNAILGFAQLLESGSPPPTPSEKRSIEQILKAGWYLLDLINEILDLALIESGKLPLSLEPISLTEVVRECQVMIGPQAQKRGIRLRFPQGEVPIFVNADRTRVKQVLINLLSNAIKYNKVSGTVDVDYAASTPGRIRVRVKDTGEGLTPNKMTQLFRPFDRLGKETGVEEGTGIGLMVSKQLVELMGGVIGVESTLGKGSVFWIELNVTAEPQTAAGAATLTAVAQAPMQAGAQLRTLLYVEDNPANLMLVEDLIARRPELRLLSAADGIRGVEMARASRPDVILMDINLPGISGFQALEILRADPATAHIPVVALSANAMPRDIEKGLAAGFFRYLTKPIKVNELMDTLDAALKFSKTASGRAAKKEPA